MACKRSGVQIPLAPPEKSLVGGAFFCSPDGSRARRRRSFRVVPSRLPARARRSLLFVVLAATVSWPAAGARGAVPVIGDDRPYRAQSRVPPQLPVRSLLV